MRRKLQRFYCRYVTLYPLDTASRGRFDEYDNDRSRFDWRPEYEEVCQEIKGSLQEGVLRSKMPAYSTLW